MRTAVTIAWEHGAKKTRMLLGPEVPIQEQITAFKKLPANNVHEEFERVELWESGFGISKHRKFISESEANRRAIARNLAVPIKPETKKKK